MARKMLNVQMQKSNPDFQNTLDESIEIKKIFMIEWNYIAGLS